MIGNTKAFIHGKSIAMEGSSSEITILESSDMLSIYDTSENVDGKVTVANLASYLISNGYVSGGVNGGGVTTTLDIGTVVNWAGHTWIVVHVGEGLTYLALKEIYSMTAFNNSYYNGNQVYAGSILASVAKSFEDSLPPVSLSVAVEQTISGVTSKIWIPTTSQANGNFDWYKTQENRKAYYGTNIKSWWLSTGGSTTNMAYCVYIDGKVNNSVIVDTYYGDGPFIYGFRPHVALRL